MPSGGINLGPQLAKAMDLGGTSYSDAEKRTVDGIVGEQDIFGQVDGINGHYETSIQVRWYHPGTSKDPNDTSVEIVLIYKFETDHKPPKMGWFDDATAKEMGLTPEKFMSMWEATLKSFKRQR